MMKITNYKMTREQFEENAAHLERAQWILNADRKLEGEDLREALQEIGDVLENFETIREHASNIYRAGKTEPKHYELAKCLNENCFKMAEHAAPYCAGHAPYLKPTPDKKPEKIGRIRI